MRITYGTKAPNGPAFAYVFVALAALFAVGIAALAVSLETFGVGTVDALIARAPSLVFGLMLASLAAVVVSVILPERIGRTTLGVGAVGFFVCIAAALVFGLSF